MNTQPNKTTDEIDVTDQISPTVRDRLQVLTQGSSSSAPLAGANASHGLGKAANREPVNQAHLCYGSVAGSITQGVSTLLDACFPPTARHIDCSEPDFVMRFAQKADQLAEGFCCKAASAIKQFTHFDEVRSTQDNVLARLIRSRCFIAQDALIRELIAWLRKENVKIPPAMLSIGASRGDIAVCSAKEIRQPDSIVSSYLESLGSLPEALLDYVRSKTFGGSSDAAQFSRHAETCLFALDEKLRAAKLVATGRNPVQSGTSYLLTPDLTELDLSAPPATKNSRRSFLGRQLVLSILFALPISVIASVEHVGYYAIITAMVSAGLSIIFFYRFISRLVT